VGFELDATERRRRWLVKTLLRADGVDRRAWRIRFGSDVVDDFPQLSELDDLGWLTREPQWLCVSGRRGGRPRR
jgi:coproporphyrinogen III oxidase-like Fe-S oxidoreductase